MSMWSMPRCYDSTMTTTLGTRTVGTDRKQTAVWFDWVSTMLVVHET